MAKHATTELEQVESGGGAHILAIVIGMVLGVTVGLLFGRQMWLASGGPAAEVSMLEATAKQKAERAEALAATNPEEAERLRSHIPKIEARLSATRELAAEADAEGVSWFAHATWVFTKFCGDVFLQALKLMV